LPIYFLLLSLTSTSAEAVPSLFERPLLFTEQVQQETLHGIVLDPSGTPLQGVSVFLAESDQGTVSDEQGRFSLTIGSQTLNSASELQITFVGYQSQRIVIGSKIGSASCRDRV